MALVQEKKHIPTEAARESIRSRTTSWLIEQKQRNLPLPKFPLKNQIQATQTSTLLNLPFEIRRQIYLLLFRSIDLAIYNISNGKLQRLCGGYHQPTAQKYCWTCSNPRRSQSKSHYPNCNQNQAQFSPEVQLDASGRNACQCLGDTTYRRHPSPVTSLLQACCQVRAELLPEFYSQIALRFLSLAALDTFLSLVPNDHIAHIRTIELRWIVCQPIYQHEPHTLRAAAAAVFHVKERLHNYIACRRKEATWEKVCEEMSAMPALTNLHVILIMHEKLGSENALLGPLMEIRGLKSFLVEVSWSEEDAGSLLVKDLPFWIRRPRIIQHANA